MLLENSFTEGVVLISSEDNHVRYCGIKYKNYILTSGVVLSPHIDSDAALSALYSNKPNNSNLFPYFMKINGIQHISDLKYFVIVEDKPRSASSIQDREFIIDNFPSAYVVTIFKSELVYRYLRGSLSGRNLGGGVFNTEGIQGLLSMFVLLQIGEVPKNYVSKDLLTLFLLLTSSTPTISRGLDVIVESSPFTMLEYLNSWSKGIVSSVVGDKNCIFLTDNRLVTGCNGAPIYSCVGKDKKGNLIGMILNPMLSSRSEWAGFSLAVNLHPVLQEVLNWTKQIKLQKVAAPQESLVEFIDLLDSSVVLVRHGLSWGSGVVVDSDTGIILTCSHVVNYKTNQLVSVECGGYVTSATVVYSTRENHAFDLAVLCADLTSNFRHLPLAEKAPVKGETVYCVGFPLTDKGHVALSKGVISKVVDDILIQTTCCILPGVSGGAIVRPNGQLIGVPVNNVSCATTSALYPHFNYTVPVAAFSKSLNRYFNTKDINCLKEMTSDSPVVHQTWLFDTKCKI